MISISTALFRSQIQEWIPVVIRDAIENPATLPGLFFRLLANNPTGSNPDAYIAKGISIFNRSTLPLFLVTIIFGTTALLSTYKKGLLNSWYQAIKIDLSWKSTIVAGISLGFLTAIRILGPLAGLLVSLFFIFKFKRRSISGIIVYAVIAFSTMYFLWPYLWRSPISGLFAVVKHMANNPQNVPVLFNGQVISSKALPLDYFFNNARTHANRTCLDFIFHGRSDFHSLNGQREIELEGIRSFFVMVLDSIYICHPYHPSAI